MVLPLTLITRIYGMNFGRVPELRVPWGCFVTLGAMTGLAVVILLDFWRIELAPRRGGPGLAAPSGGRG